MVGERGVDTVPVRRSSNDVTSCDSASVFTVKALLYPVTVVLLLMVCLWWWQRPFAGPYFLMAVIAFAGVGELLDLSRIEYQHSAVRALKYISFRWYALSACMLLLLYLSHAGVPLTEPPLLAWLLLTPWVLWGMHVFVWGLLVNVGVKYMPVRTAVIVGVTEHGMQLAQMLGTQSLLRIKCLGFFDDQPADGAVAAAQRLGSIGEVAEFVRHRNIQLVYITLPMSRSAPLLRLLDDLRDSVASVYFVPDMLATSLIEARIEVVHGVPLIAVRESPFFGVHSIAKRLSDLIIASVVLIAILPVLVVVAIGVKLSSPGPVLFKQRRYGLDGRQILVYKFRSMSVTEDGDRHYVQVTRSDSRVTPFGAFIRRTSLDELPQFFNVLEGSMSVVGPRPHAVAVNERYRAQIPSYMIRHKVKPGITGWAQVNGYRGGDDLHTMTKRIEFDLDYLSNWSLWLDLKIILRTVAVVIKDRHAY